jgi:putative transposase
VEACFVTESTDWKYSSARNYALDDQSVLEIDLA